MSRPGITLLEVLVAIFIMGIGMLAILVLFPLGALNMARALKDDRCAHIAASSDSTVTATNLRNDPNVAPALSIAPPGGAYDPPDPNGVGFPVMVDPYGVLGTLPNTVGTSPSSSPVQRVSPSFVGSFAAANRWFSMIDDLTFNQNGEPYLSGGTNLQRQGYYTTAYVLRRLQSSQGNTTELNVIAFKGRPVQVPVGEPIYGLAGVGNIGDTSVVLTWGAGQVLPELGKGSWLFDISYSRKPGAVPGTFYGVPHCQFYRVNAALQTSATTMTVEVQPPLRDTGVTQMAVLSNAVEIFYRGTGN